MAKVRVGVVGYGTIGERIADGVAAQGDMELVGVCDIAPTVPVRALIKSRKDIPLYCAAAERIKDLEAAGGKVAGTLEDLLGKVDMICDATTPGIGAQNRKKYEAAGVKATFQAGEKTGVGDVQFNSMANYDKAYGQSYIHILSCNNFNRITVILFSPGYSMQIDQNIRFNCFCSFYYFLNRSSYD